MPGSDYDCIEIGHDSTQMRFAHVGNRIVAQFVFSLTLFISAALLFWIQLLTSKVILPILGGSASVWNTCMMFFQIALLLGYLYAHVANRTCSGRFWIFLHPALLAIAALSLNL